MPLILRSIKHQAQLVLYAYAGYHGRKRDLNGGKREEPCSLYLYGGVFCCILLGRKKLNLQTQRVLRFRLRACRLSLCVFDVNEKIFATFQTSMGNFKAELFHVHAPLSVSNFVRLATGRQRWKDPKSKKVVQKPFYKGLIFHRVIPNFMIQGGCPMGTGRSGPGYTFRDEFSEFLKHDKPGMLSMANAGPGTNGSQFFITVAATPHLDKRHSIFGQVRENYRVVEAISKVQTDAQDRPARPVSIKNVLISRVKTPAPNKTSDKTSNKNKTQKVSEAPKATKGLKTMQPSNESQKVSNARAAGSDEKSLF